MILLAIPVAILLMVFLARKQGAIENDHNYRGGLLHWQQEPDGYWHCYEARRPAFVGEDGASPTYVEIYPDGNPNSFFTSPHF